MISRDLREGVPHAFREPDNDFVGFPVIPSLKMWGTVAKFRFVRLTLRPSEAYTFDMEMQRRTNP